MFTLLNKTSVARKTGGFTLVELLVVIVVIGLLAAIAVPIFLSQADKANTASAESDAANIAKLIQADYAETGTVSAMNGSTYTSANGFGSVTAAGTVTLSGDATTWCVESDVDGQVASFSAENGAGTGCSAGGGFYAVSTPSEWGTLTAPASLCGTSATFSGSYPYGGGSVNGSTVADWNTSANAWSYSIDGGEFTQWLPEFTGDIYGGSGAGQIMLPDSSWGAWATNSSLCGLTTGQQVQFQTPSGYYTSILTVN